MEVAPNAAGDGVDMKRFRGTCFLIGSRGVLVTAEHIFRDAQTTLAVATIDEELSWRAWPIAAAERHPTEDVAVAIAPDLTRESHLRVTSNAKLSTVPWELFGYPDDVLYALEFGGTRPDLVYVNGSVRRRMSGIAVPQIRGQQLYELNGLGGTGCSGGPVIHRVGTDWEVFGVYIGERLAPDRGLLVSYAARLDNLAEWVPRFLAHTLVSECDQVAQTD